MYKKNVVLIYETKCPIQIETCLRALLYDYRYKNRKDFFICHLKIVKKALNYCKKSVQCMQQKGGNFYFYDDIFQLKINLECAKNKINKKIIHLQTNH